MGDLISPILFGKIPMEKKQLPRHVAIIMDGNGRWARARGLSRTQGHMEGVKRVEETIHTAHDVGIEFLDLVCFFNRELAQTIR
jgi:undecaprenyl diphosphate synthase